jgi:hypothetical protein
MLINCPVRKRIHFFRPCFVCKNPVGMTDFGIQGCRVSNCPLHNGIHFFSPGFIYKTCMQNEFGV